MVWLVVGCCDNLRVRTGSIGSVRGHRISDTNGSVSGAPRYAIKVLLKQPWSEACRKPVYCHADRASLGCDPRDR